MPVTTFSTPEKYDYMNGFGGFHDSEAVKGALPIGANSPQSAPYGLYTEKLSGTSFTAPRHENKQSWLYRILPSASHTAFQPIGENEDFSPKLQRIPNQLRWDPFDVDGEVDWIKSIKKVAGAGDPTMKTGIGIYVYAAGCDMDASTATYNSDGEMLVVAQLGVMDVTTEFGKILVRPNEILIIPRGVKYRVDLLDGPIRGYILELHQGNFILPELGPIGSNCLANPRDFQIPTASYVQNTETEWTIINKFGGRMFAATQRHTPFDVVAWHGNYYPYKYDLGRFSVIGSTSFDHPDPSIYTVLTAPSDHPGTAVADFVIFPPRWLVQEGTFRPPWYHRNTMSEFMGLICGQYDAKAKGFQAAGASLHNVMAAHGPDASTFETASHAVLKPQKVGEGSMAFMFESSLMLGVTEWGLETCRKLQSGYSEESWGDLRPHFKLP